MGTETNRQKTWRLLNSPLVLWALTSVVLAGLIEVNGCRQETTSKINAAREDTSSIRTELKRRIEICRNDLDANLIPRALYTLDGTQGTVFAKYQNVSLSDLCRQFDEAQGRLGQPRLTFLDELIVPSQAMVKGLKTVEEQKARVAHVIAKIKQEIVD